MLSQLSDFTTLISILSSIYLALPQTSLACLGNFLAPYNKILQIFEVLLS